MQEIIHAMFSDPVALSVFWVAIGIIGVLIVLINIVVICVVRVNHNKEMPKIKESDKR